MPALYPIRFNQPEKSFVSRGRDFFMPLILYGRSAGMNALTSSQYRAPGGACSLGNRMLSGTGPKMLDVCRGRQSLTEALGLELSSGRDVELETAPVVDSVKSEDSEKEGDVRDSEAVSRLVHSG